MKTLGRLVDAVGVSVIATAVLYFWGYIYYAAHTEKLGVPFHGISIPPQEYLTASWFAVAILFVSFVSILILTPLVTALIDGLAVRLRKRYGKPLLTAEERGLIPARPVVVLLLSALALMGGTRLMLNQGQEEAERVSRMAPEVMIWAADGKPIEGHFVYMRNFGSTLLVKEMSADMKTSIGYRFFKESTYGSYSLVPRTWSVKWRPTTDKIP